MKDAKLLFHFYRALPWQIQQQDTFTGKKNTVRIDTLREALALVQMNVRRRLAKAFFARLFSQSMNQKPSQNGFISRSPLVVILEYHTIVTSSFTNASSDYHESDNLRIDWPVSQQLLSRHHINSSLRFDSPTSITCGF